MSTIPARLASALSSFHAASRECDAAWRLHRAGKCDDTALAEARKEKDEAHAYFRDLMGDLEPEDFGGEADSDDERDLEKLADDPKGESK